MEGFSCYDRSFIFCPKGREKVLVECVSRNILTRGAKREQTLPISSFPIVNVPKNKFIKKKMRQKGKTKTEPDCKTCFQIASCRIFADFLQVRVCVFVRMMVAH